MNDNPAAYDMSEEKSHHGSADSLLEHNDHDPIQFRPRRREPRISWPVALHLTAVMTYGLAAVLFGYYYNSRQPHGQSMIYSPANDVVEYETHPYDLDAFGDPDYFGEPSEDIDHNWNKLLSPATIHLTEAERKHYDAGKPIVQMSDGSYFGQLFVYHELHCLKRIHQYMNLDYYFSNLTDWEKDMNRRHTEHCLGTLRQAVMCHGDVTIMPMVWGKHSRVPLGEFSNPHQCVDFDKLHEWALTRKVTDGTQPGVLVHPILGPSFPDGHGDKIGFSDDDLDPETGKIITIND